MSSRCAKGYHRCAVTRKCHHRIRKTRSNSKRCARGTSKCADRHCYTHPASLNLVALSTRPKHK